MTAIRAKFASGLLVFTLCFAGPAPALAFKIGYRGIPVVVDDFPPVHEAVTAAAVAHFCRSVGIAELQGSRLYQALFRASLGSCDDLEFDLDMGAWRTQMKTSPIADLLLGARYPDLREMTGVDADKQDVTVVKFDDEVQIDSYRLYPQFHGQLSKYHNIWGGDMLRGLQHLRTFTRAVFYEVAALMLSHDPKVSQRNDFVASNAMLDHDTNTTLEGLFYDVRWHSILLGILFHSMEDGFSHDPLRILDVEKNRLTNAALFYGKFKNSAGEVVGITDLYPEIDPDMDASMDALKGFAPIVEYSGLGPLNVADIPEATDAAGTATKNWYEHDGKRYQSGHLATTLSMYAASEFLTLLRLAVDHPESPAKTELALEAYLDKYFSIDLEATAGYTPTRTQDIAANDPQYAELPWYNYHFVDLWKQSGLDDRVKDGKQAFILPWSSRDSMGDLLKSEDIGTHFVVVPSDASRFEAERGVYYVERNSFALFASWYRAGANDVLEKRLRLADFFVDQQVKELEVEIDSSDLAGLDKVYASAFIPAGYRACFKSESTLDGERQKARTASYDGSHPIYRCFYGTEEGRWAHINFHLRKGTRITLVPIDGDLDGVPFVRGIADDVYADNCPLVANRDQADSDRDGIGDACQSCPFTACDDPGEGPADGGTGGAGGVASSGGVGDGASDPTGPSGPGSSSDEAGHAGCSASAPSQPTWLGLLVLVSLTALSSRRRKTRV